MKPTLESARELDQQDELREYRNEFLIPHVDGKSDVYLVGNSLGLLPRRTKGFVQKELDHWAELGVRGHFSGEHPWVAYHEFLTEPMAQIVGGQPDEVITMNTLTVNLHLMMATFYRPRSSNKSGKAARNKILIEQHAFPSDKNAVESQIRLHGNSPEECLIEIAPDDGEILSTDKILETIEANKGSLALILLPGVQYYTGQVFEMEKITEFAHGHDIIVGFDLAHAAGNVELSLHDWGVDFACWCTYKYLNSGPGSIAGCFIHQRHAGDSSLDRLAGWWGHDKKSRFEMSGEFDAIPTAEGWQLSNPPILSLAAIRASLEVFSEAGGMARLNQKSKRQGDFFRACLAERLGDKVNVICPAVHSGCQLSLEVKLGGIDGKDVHEKLESKGVRTDWREPNVIRAAPTPLYNTFEDIWNFVELLGQSIE